jgi:hypothetical protein
MDERLEGYLNFMTNGGQRMEYTVEIDINGKTILYGRDLKLRVGSPRVKNNNYLKEKAVW